MKAKLGKVMTLFLVTGLLFGCKAKSQNITKVNTEEVSVSIMETAKLTEKESFYLNASGNNLLAYDAKFKKDIRSLTFNLYKYTGKHWEKIDKGNIPLDNTGDAWIVVSEHLSDFKICVKRGNSMISQQKDPLKPLWEEGYTADTDVVQKYTIEKDKEFPVVAYRRFHVDDTSERKAYLNDFQNTENIKADKNDEYFMLTFIFE